MQQQLLNRSFSMPLAIAVCKLWHAAASYVISGRGSDLADLTDTSSSESVENPVNHCPCQDSTLKPKRSIPAP